MLTLDCAQRAGESWIQLSVANHLIIISEVMNWAPGRHTFRPGADVTPGWCMRREKKSTRSKTAVFTSGCTVRMANEHNGTLYWD